MNRPASNICAFGRGVLEKFKTNFDELLSKDEGWDQKIMSCSSSRQWWMLWPMAIYHANSLSTGIDEAAQICLFYRWDDGFLRLTKLVQP